MQIKTENNNITRAHGYYQALVKRSAIRRILNKTVCLWKRRGVSSIKTVDLKTTIKDNVSG